MNTASPFPDPPKAGQPGVDSPYSILVCVNGKEDNTVRPLSPELRRELEKKGILIPDSNSTPTPKM